jgi:hypothetical protein
MNAKSTFSKRNCCFLVALSIALLILGCAPHETLDDKTTYQSKDNAFVRMSKLVPNVFTVPPFNAEFNDCDSAPQTAINVCPAAWFFRYTYFDTVKIRSNENLNQFYNDFRTNSFYSDYAAIIPLDNVKTIMRINSKGDFSSGFGIILFEVVDKDQFLDALENLPARPLKKEYKGYQYWEIPNGHNEAIGIINNYIIFSTSSLFKLMVDNLDTDKNSLYALLEEESLMPKGDYFLIEILGTKDFKDKKESIVKVTSYSLKDVGLGNTDFSPQIYRKYLSPLFLI